MSFIDAEKLAREIYPEKQESNPEFLGLYQDANAYKRDIAIEVIDRIESVFFNEDSARNVMHAFYRREHHKEPKDHEVEDLTCHMLTAFMAIDMYRNKVD